MFRQMLTLRFFLVHYFRSEPLTVWTSSLWFQLPPNLIILNGTPAWYKYKLCTYFLIFLFRFFPLIWERLSPYEWITFLHFLTLSLWDTKKELSQICHLFSRVLLIFFIVIIIAIMVTIIIIIIITTQQSPLNLSHRYSLLNYLRNFVSLSSDCSEPRPIWTFQL